MKLIKKFFFFVLAILIFFTIKNINAQNTEKQKIYKEKKFIYSSKAKKDPFIPLIGIVNDYKEQSLSTRTVVLGKNVVELSLDGILWDPKNESYAIINDSIISVGEKLENFILSNIEKDYIEISDGTHFVKITIEKPE